MAIHSNLTVNDFRDAEFIVFPIHKTNHWLAAAIEPSTRTIYVCDSKRSYNESLIQVFKTLEIQFTENILGITSDNIQWIYKDLSSEAPYQADHFSCGPLSILNMEYLVRKKPLNYNIQSVIKKLRFNICMSVILQDYS